MTDLNYCAHGVEEAEARFLYNAKLRDLVRETSPDLVVEFIDDLQAMPSGGLRDKTPLMALAEAGNWDAVRVVLKERPALVHERSGVYDWSFTHTLAGRDTPSDVWTRVVDLAPELVNAENCTGLTPLGAASAHGNCAAMRFLLLEAAGVDGGSRGAFPLALASMLCGAEPINLLIKAGARVDFSRADGVTALMTAATHDNVEAIEALRAAGADEALLDRNKQTALMLAREAKSNEAVKALGGGTTKAKKVKAKKAKKTVKAPA
jgi:ankyrin repeat protein